MDLGLTGKKALITGATKGIGRATAETLLAEGASVAICARTAEGVDAAVAELSQLGTVVGSVVDAGDSDALVAWVNSSAEQLGGIDIYVHNTSGKPARSNEAWINNFNIDLMSLIYGAGAASEALADGGGSLISLGTTAVAEHFASGSGSYSAFKSAVTNWTLGQAQVLGAKGHPLQRRVARPDLHRRRRLEHDQGPHGRLLRGHREGPPRRRARHRAGRRRRHCLPRQRPSPPRERCQRHRRRRVPQARRLLR